MDSNNIQEILEDLYSLDPSLIGKENELINIIKKAIAAKPEVKFDESFRKALRNKLLEADKNNDEFIYFYNLNPMKKFFYAVIGVGALIMIITPVYVSWQAKQKTTSHKEGQVMALTINRVGDNSFGNLASSSGQNQTPQAERSSASVPLGAISSVVPGMGGGAASSQTDAKMIAAPYFEYKTYRFVYKGGEFKVDEKMDVLRRLKGEEVSADLGSIADNLNLGLANLNTFSGLSIQNINLVQKGDKSYSIDISPKEGMINIYQNWEAWPLGKCFDDTNCYENEKVRQEDMMSNEELINIAENFLTDHNISKSNYGSPEVSPANNWRVLYEASPLKNQFYFPESVEIVYPLKINDRITYEEYNGFKQGLTVTVNIKNKKVAGVSNLLTQNYESSSYDMETDTKKIISLAEKGGINNYYYADSQIVEDLELTDPELIYTKHYSYKNGKTLELLVPALYFPIKDLPQDPNFYRKGVVVPLAADILAEKEDSGRGGVIPILHGVKEEVISPEAGINSLPPDRIMPLGTEQ